MRLDRDHYRPIAGDSDLADAIKLPARAHQTAIWERTRQVLRLRSTLLEYFPAAVQAFEDLSAPDALALLARAADSAMTLDDSPTPARKNYSGQSPITRASGKKSIVLARYATDSVPHCTSKRSPR